MFFSIDPDDIPEPIRSQMEAHIKQSQDEQVFAGMVRSDFRNAIKSLILEASLEHLVTIRGLIQAISRDDTGRTGAFFDGLVTYHLELVHKVCAKCGGNHEEDLFDHQSTQEKPFSQEKWDKLETAVTKVETESSDEITTEQLMIEYKVEPGGEIYPPGTVICTNRPECSYVWPSLEDRMLRAPDQCPMCTHKAKWG